MSEQASDTLRCSPGEGRQTMSIHTRKITDSCRDKDCIEDLRVYLTTGSQALLDTAARASLPTNFPTMTLSAVLYSC